MELFQNSLNRNLPLWCNGSMMSSNLIGVGSTLSGPAINIMKKVNFTQKQKEDIMLHMYRNELQGYNSGVARDFAQLFCCKKKDIIDFYEKNKEEYVKSGWI